MKNTPLSLFNYYSANRFVHNFHLYFSFDQNLSKKDFIGIKTNKIKPLKVIDGTKKKVYLYENWVVKKEFKPFRIRMSYLYKFTHSSRGHRGAIGEAVNTLVANILNAPSHKLSGVCINFFTGDITAIYSKISTIKSLGEIILSETHNIDFLIKNVILNLLKIIDLKIMHADIHLDNIFYDPNKNSIKLIDFEMAVIANGERHISLGCMLSKFYQREIKELLPFNEYTDLISKTLMEEFSSKEITEIIEIIEKYPPKLSYKERTTLLNMASLNRPALSLLLDQTSKL